MELTDKKSLIELLSKIDTRLSELEEKSKSKEDDNHQEDDKSKEDDNHQEDDKSKEDDNDTELDEIEKLLED